MVLIKKPRFDKYSKGYRLRKKTHKLIDRIQRIMRADQDEVITKACQLLYKQLHENSEQKDVSVNNK